MAGVIGLSWASMTMLIIARHGNTFEKGEPPRRVGGRTDIPLTDAGRVQARAIGNWMKANNIYPQAVYSSELRRTKETASLALDEAGYKEHVFPLALFNEIDYGPDENLPEDAVKSRLGEQALKDWDEKAVVPPGWNFDPARCVAGWKDFADHIVEDRQECALVVTSNGIARFAPHITGDFDGFLKEHKLKLSTGSLGVLQFEQGQWKALAWNLSPIL